MKQLLLTLFISANALSQSIGINDLIDFKTQSVGKIEETLILKNWVLDEVHENNRTGVFELLGNEKIYIFRLNDNYNKEIAKIFITVNDKNTDNNGIKYSTEDSELNQKIILNLKRNDFNMIESGTDLVNMNFNPKVNDILVKDSILKKYSDGQNEVNLTTNIFVKVVKVEKENYYSNNYKTVYELSL
ncbi:hypothetical protein [Aequorivita antarctica]|uniref:Uncharacterized protein n=1 Tax=Aequorivita antarctica TaxID=153266 RepID=A0A5C6YUM5_9FLAO|nr:hypothetical protein [Aequorivita antarctica]TXD71261.1 hypothetical protein ESU54_17455 [Aequorivita antarctica]